jgi:hypothetical protein
MGGVNWTCKHCQLPLRERAFWSHDHDVVFIQSQPPLPGEAPGRTIWVVSPLVHEPEPEPVVETVPVSQAEIEEMRKIIADLKKEKGVS